VVIVHVLVLELVLVLVLVLGARRRVYCMRVMLASWLIGTMIVITILF
jgi:hypothetical protein